MSRWGAEESKTRGIGGCLIALFVLVGIIYAFLQVYPIIEGRKQLEEGVHAVCRTAHGKTESMILADLLAKARDLDLPVERENISIKKVKDSNSNFVLEVHLKYTHSADFGFFTKEFPVSITENVVLIVF